MERGSPGCDEVLALLTDYLDEALPADRQPGVAAHLDRCPPCSAGLARLVATITALAGLREAGAPAPLRALLLERFGTRARTVTPHGRHERRHS
ncbi:anti-sigma factor family protein [Nonomuraea candida]|uniref:anti-sigma factor family protein n=1 Tax=Nonomuraea candida TaxID=359159 RepID=UPI0005BC2172|nr:zf-HC2 domain-containing protein [Nonomuraea candida]